MNWNKAPESLLCEGSMCVFDLSPEYKMLRASLLFGFVQIQEAYWATYNYGLGAYRRQHYIGWHKG